MPKTNRSIEDRFWKKVRMFENGCWAWFAAKNAGGYGQFNVNGKMVGAHCYSYKLAYGPIPEGKEINHICRYKLCIAPYHLEALTYKEHFEVDKDVRSGMKHRLIAGMPKTSPFASRYRGVDYRKTNKMWRARISKDGKSIYLGLFSSEKKAVKAYQNALNNLAKGKP